MEVTRTVGQILCCECGLSIEPNPSNMCVSCIRSRVDITEGIPKFAQLQLCKFCGRYFHPPNSWTYAELESKELLAVCLKKLKQPLNKVRLVDAGFIWTEPHSKRIKVKLTIQKEIQGGAILQQAFPVEYTVASKMCDDCTRIEAKDYWRACVQVRQKAQHKKTLFYLEQLILKHKAHNKANGIKQVLGGMDFYYARQNEARRLVDFLLNVLPCRYQASADLGDEEGEVEIPHGQGARVPGRAEQHLRLQAHHRRGDRPHLQVGDVSATAYFRDPFESLCGPKQLVEYTVINIEEAQCHRGTGHGTISHKHQVADAWVMKSSELGRSDAEEICVKTHLGHLLNPGDQVLGLDLKHSNANNWTLDKIPEDKRPEVVLVKKVYDKQRRHRRRRWELKRLEGERMDTESLNNEYNDFMEDLEEDPTVRHNINIYKKTTVETASTVGDEDEDFPTISLAEMLEDLVIEDDPMGDELEEPESLHQ